MEKVFIFYLRCVELGGFATKFFFIFLCFLCFFLGKLETPGLPNDTAELELLRDLTNYDRLLGQSTISGLVLQSGLVPSPRTSD